MQAVNATNGDLIWEYKRDLPAKLLAENPVLARIKEMELLKDVLAGTTATFVFGDGDVAEQVRGLVAKGV